MFVSPVKAMKYIKKARDNFLIFSSLNTLNNCFRGFLKFELIYLIRFEAWFLANKRILV